MTSSPLGFVASKAIPAAQTYDNSPPAQGLPMVNRTDMTSYPQDNTRLDAHSRGRRQDGALRGDRPDGDGGRRFASDGMSDCGRAPRGHLARPDRNQRPFLPDVQCDACKRVVHVARHCDMLATAICLERYMKHDMSPGVRDSIEKEWLNRWHERLGNPSRTPRQVLRAYVEELDITLAGLDDAMEWDMWAADDVDILPDE